MSAAFSTLELIPRVRQGEVDSFGLYKTERAFLDFVVDRISLHEAMARERDLASVLWSNPSVPAEIEKCVRRLMLLDPGDLPDGRISLYTCAECGDMGCGGVTADIQFRDGAIVWSNFGYQYYDYGEEKWKLNKDSFQQFGPYKFALTSYRAVLLESLLLDRIH